MPKLDLPNPPDFSSRRYQVRDASGSLDVSAFMQDLNRWSKNVNSQLQMFAQQISAASGKTFIVATIPEVLPTAISNSSSLTDVAGVVAYMLSVLQDKNIIIAQPRS